jgi:hypothetical protein
LEQEREAVAVMLGKMDVRGGTLASTMFNTAIPAMTESSVMD